MGIYFIIEKKYIIDFFHGLLRIRSLTYIDIFYIVMLLTVCLCLTFSKIGYNRQLSINLWRGGINRKYIQKNRYQSLRSVLHSGHALVLLSHSFRHFLW